jgi:hypothetical protein
MNFRAIITFCIYHWYLIVLALENVKEKWCQLTHRGGHAWVPTKPALRKRDGVYATCSRCGATR